MKNIGQGLSDIKPTTQGNHCHRPRLLGHDRCATGVKGGVNTAHNALHLKLHWTGWKDKSATPPTLLTPVAMGKGRNHRWKMSLEVAVLILHAGNSEYQSSDVDLRRQHHLAAPWKTKQPSLGYHCLLHKERRREKVTKPKSASHPSVILPRSMGIFSSDLKALKQGK